ncbi:hypothetical protein CesoFtcFv8_022530 [Champsocephalus esox]|uniref:Uncharacterized protein n=1 Tax=Champsocephalus esox TaxID=159716 RepID=A0AAN8GLJ1_9TELE|nr:hypothetical protein CesoFtcFv8_022530 [Champsocephalus esox]
METGQESQGCVRDCLVCGSGYIMSFDRHSQCESCLGIEHANAALTPGVSCSHCARLPLALRQPRTIGPSRRSTPGQSP